MGIRAGEEAVQRNGLRSSVVKKKDRGTKIVLQDRDYEILRWLNEMGPQDAVCIGQRFFCQPGDTLTLARIETTSRRLRELSAAKMLQSFRIELERQNFYRATSSAVGILQSKYQQARQLNAQTTIGLSTFEHNIQVAWTRVALERRGDAKGWRGERRLLSEDRPIQIARLCGRSAPYVPDAIYAAQDGRKTMLELELSPKTERQARARVETITGLISKMGDRYQGAHFVCSTEAIAERYRMLTLSFGFRVETFEGLLREAGIYDSYKQFRG